MLPEKQSTVAPEVPLPDPDPMRATTPRTATSATRTSTGEHRSAFIGFLDSKLDRFLRMMPGILHLARGMEQLPSQSCESPVTPCRQDVPWLKLLTGVHMTEWVSRASKVLWVVAPLALGSACFSQELNSFTAYSRPTR